MLRTLYHNFSCKKEIYMSIYYSYSTNSNNLIRICKYLNISENEGKFLQTKYPNVNKLDDSTIENYLNTLKDLGFNENALIKEPALFNISPKKIRLRHIILQECGINNVSTKTIVTYFKILRQKIKDLKTKGLMSHSLNVEYKLASCLTETPSSLTNLIEGDINDYSLYSLRIKVIQIFLETELNLANEDFLRGLETYRNIKYCSLQSLRDILLLLLSDVSLPSDLIKNNMFLLHASTNNLKNILSTFKPISGKTVKEIIRKDPTLVLRNYLTLLEIRNILEEFGIDFEKYINNYSFLHLSPKAVRERLENIIKLPELRMMHANQEFLLLVLNTRRKQKDVIEFIKTLNKHYHNLENKGYVKK